MLGMVQVLAWFPAVIISRSILRVMRTNLLQKRLTRKSRDLFGRILFTALPASGWLPVGACCSARTRGQERALPVPRSRRRRGLRADGRAARSARLPGAQRGQCGERRTPSTLPHTLIETVFDDSYNTSWPGLLQFLDW